MKEQNKLFSLIKSLTKSEKAYFKKYAKTHLTSDQKDYLMLFEAISKQHQYDEAKLKRKFRTAAFAQHFAATKSYLYKQLIKSLQFYNHRAPNSIKKINNLIEEATILLEKSLYQEASKVLNNAAKIAERIGASHKLLEISHIKIVNYRQINDTVQHRRTLLSKRREFRDLFNQEIQYQELYFDLLDHAQQYFSLREEKYKQASRSVIEHPIFQDISFAKTRMAKTAYYGTRFYYYYFFQDYENALKEIKALIAFRQSYEMESENAYESFLSTLHSWGLICVKLKRFEEILEIIVIYKSLKPITKRLEIIRTHNILLWHARYYYHVDNLEYMITNLTKDYDKMWDYQGIITPNQFALLTYDFARANFIMGNYETTLMYIEKKNKIEKQISSIYQKSLFCFLNLLTHYELKHERYLESAIKNAKYFFKKEAFYYQFESLLLNQLVKLLNSTRGEKKLILEELKTSLFTLFESKEGDVEFYREGITIYWIESQLEGVSLREVVAKSNN